MFHPLDGLGELGERVPGPPWILGRRGLPAVAPENTIAALNGAVEFGLDGVFYELRACASGELVLLADPTLERTTDGHGPVAAKTLPELAGIDAGSWFQRRFAGERLALFEEALELQCARPGEYPMHVIELCSPRLASEVARVLEGRDNRSTLRVASRSREVCVELRDLGLETMLLIASARDEDREFVRDERLTAVGILGGAWRGPAAQSAWSCERWALSVDDPADLLDCARIPLLGLATREPLRALAARALARFAPEDEGGWPIAPLELELGSVPAARHAVVRQAGEWSGAWNVEAKIRNPFGWPVSATVGLRVRRGAFDFEGLPLSLEIAPGETATVPFRLSGGSWSPGGDPVLVAAMSWRRGPGRPEERLFFDTPLARMRRARLAGGSTRLLLLCERPGDSAASVTLSCRKDQLQVAIESAGGLREPELLVSLDGRLHRGGTRMQLELPARARSSAKGLAFSVGISGRDGKETRLRRWAGGLPDEWEAGAPGRLIVERRA